MLPLAGLLLQYLSHVSHDSIFLCVNETLQHDSNRHINIITVHIFSKVHSGVSLSDTNDRLNVSNCDGNTASSLQSNKTTVRSVVTNTVAR